MKEFDYTTAINKLKLDKTPLNKNIKMLEIPLWAQSTNFMKNFLPYLKIIGDSREQDKWVETACNFYGIAFEWAKKDKALQTENLKEGDYSYKVIFGDKVYNYIGEVAFERKGSLSEIYGNLTGDRQRIEREFERFKSKGYKKVVLVLEFGEKLTDLIDAEFHYRKSQKLVVTQSVKHIVYNAIMSWKQPNNKGFDIIQSESHITIFWAMLQEMYWYFRNALKAECLNNGLIGE